MPPLTELSDYKPTIKFPKRVVVLGNDTFAWMTASMLMNRFRSLDIRVTVCPCNEVAPQGTFSTTPAFGRFLQNLGVDEHDMMRACKGTYRLATQFSDWAHEGRDFWQPVANLPVRIGGRELFDVWLSERKAGRLLRPLHSYSAHWTAALAGKSPHSFATPSAFAETGAYGFHGNQAGLAEWLRHQALNKGVEVVAGGVQKTFPNGRGGIAQVKLETGAAVPGDFFIDCRSRQDSDSWLDDASVLVCDRRVAIGLPSAGPVAPFTRNVAVENGWVSAMPLADEVQYAYSFVSSELSDEAAVSELQSQFPRGKDSSQGSDAVFSDLKHGQRDVFWKDNVVSLGRAATSMDSFATADMHLHHVGLELLMGLFPSRSIGRATRDEFNQRLRASTNQHRDFVQLHYRLAESRDTAFGRLVRKTQNSERLQQLLGVFDDSGAISETDPQSPAAWEYQSMLVGANRMPSRSPLVSFTQSPGEMQAALRKLIKHNETLVKDLPGHEELLDWIHTTPFGRAVS